MFFIFLQSFSRGVARQWQRIGLIGMLFTGVCCGGIGSWMDTTNNSTLQWGTDADVSEAPVSDEDLGPIPDFIDERLEPLATALYKLMLEPNRLSSQEWAMLDFAASFRALQSSILEYLKYLEHLGKFEDRLSYRDSLYRAFLKSVSYRNICLLIAEEHQAIRSIQMEDSPTLVSFTDPYSFSILWTGIWSRSAPLFCPVPVTHLIFMRPS